MVKGMCVKTILCSLMVTVCLWQGSARSQQTDNERSDRVNVGREDPFARFTKKKKPSTPQKISTPASVVERRPELFVETVTLKFLGAGSIKTIIEGISSKYGTISVDEKTNSLIICDTKEHLEKILAQIQRAEKTVTPPQQTIVEEEHRPELFVETVTLKFLSAKSIKEVIGDMLSEYGAISIDAKTNSLIICDTRGNLETILAEIRKADKTPEQIMIEVVIVDVQLDDGTEIGINWDLLSDVDYDVSYRQGFTSRMSTTGFVTNNTVLGGDFSVISGTIRNVVHLIQQKRDVEILASPRVMMVSGESAYIEAIEEIPYTEITGTAEGGAEALTSTEFKEVGVKLTVSATLTDDDNILLTVESEQNVATGESDTAVPIVDTRKAETSLLLKDGQVVILGGLRRQEKTKEIDQIPLLGDLPIVGALFKSTNTVVRNSELMVFLSPHIYKGEPIPDEAMAKFNEIRNRPMLSLPTKSENANKELLSILTSLEKELSW